MRQLQRNNVFVREKIKSFKKLLYLDLLFFLEAVFPSSAQVLISGFNIIGRIQYLYIYINMYFVICLSVPWVTNIV